MFSMLLLGCLISFRILFFFFFFQAEDGIRDTSVTGVKTCALPICPAPPPQFPVGDEVVELGYVDMFTDMFDAMEEDREPVETLYDGYVVNAVMDACYRSATIDRKSVA